MKLPLYREGVVKPEVFSAALVGGIRERNSSRRVTRGLLLLDVIVILKGSVTLTVSWGEDHLAG